MAHLGDRTIATCSQVDSRGGTGSVERSLEAAVFRDRFDLSILEVAADYSKQIRDLIRTRRLGLEPTVLSPLFLAHLSLL